MLPKLTREIIDAEIAEGNRRLQTNEDVQPAFTYQLRRATEDDPLMAELFAKWHQWSHEYFEKEIGVRPNLIANHVLVFGATLVNMLKRADEVEELNAASQGN